MFGNNSDHLQFQNYYEGNIDMASAPQAQRRNNQRCNYTTEDFTPPHQNMYPNEPYSNNMPFYNYQEQPMFEQNEPSFSYNYHSNEEPLYCNQNYPQFNSGSRRSNNLDRSYIMPTMDTNVNSNQFYNSSSFQNRNSSRSMKRREYIQPISESEYENEKRKEIRMERSNITSPQQKSFFSQFLDTMQSFL